MMIVSIERSASRAFDVSSRYSDSGVVMRMSAGSRWNRARSLCGVSPVRMAIAGVTIRLAAPLGDLRDAGQRRAQVALDVHRQRLERRDVQHPAAARFRRFGREHQPIEAGKKGGQRLAAAGGREDERRIAARDRRPAERLRAGWRLERAGEPLAHRRMERLQRISYSDARPRSRSYNVNGRGGEAGRDDRKRTKGTHG